MALILVGLITAASIALFASGRLRIDFVSLLVLVSLAVTGLVSPEQAIAGFANPATVTVLAMLILAAGLTRTGAVLALGRVIGLLAGGRPWRLLLILMVVASALSGFINNTAVVAVLLPVATKLAADAGVSPSKVLIPLSFASMFGGTTTLIGTSTNLLVSGLAPSYGQAPFGMFEFAPLGLILVGAGLAYMLVAGRFLLPGRKSGNLTESYHLREYVAEMAVGQDSDLVGQSMRQTGLEERFSIEVVGLVRDGQRTAWLGEQTIQAGDLLLVLGRVKELMELKDVPGLRLKAEVELGDEDLASEDVVLAEAVVTPASHVLGRTVRQVFFRQRYNLTVLAIRSRGRSLHDQLSRTPLLVGDTLLLQGRRSFLEELAQGSDFLVLGEIAPPTVRRERLWPALAIMTAVAGLAGLGVLPILVSALAGVAAMIATGCLRMQEAYDAVDWSVIFLLAGMIPLGTALEQTGAAQLVANGLLALLGGLGPWVVLSVFYLLSSTMTELMSNNATAILLSPIAAAVAGQLGVNPRPFLIAIAFAASASFMTPLGYQTNAMVYGPGRYRYTDYVKVGGPLNVLFWILASLLIPVFWPLR